MQNIKLEKHWMPFTANRDFKNSPRLAVKAEGVYYTNQKGGKVLDGASGLFNTPLGHCRAEIADAVHKQMLEMDYVPYYNTGHPWAEETSKALADILPKALDRIFYVNSGSETVDTSIKMAYAYWRAKGQGQKTVLVGRERSYHGMNLGGTALAGMVNNRRFFNISYPQVYFMRHTNLPENRWTPGVPEHGGIDLAEDLLRAINLHGAENIAACFVEPVAGSVGCYVPPKGYLERLREICTEHDILLVFDEIITGFGRTGKWFASETFGVTPDFITMSKAITNGSIPMGAVAVKREVYDTVVNAADERMIEFFHGYTTSAHPAACAACSATLATMHKEKVLDRVAKLRKYFEKALFELQDLPLVQDIRTYGVFAGVDLKPVPGKPSLRGSEAYQKLFWEGLHCKATGDTLAIAPAFVMEEAQIDELCGHLRKVLSEMKE